MPSKAFRGEVWTNTHPEIMAQMLNANATEVDGKVGHDSYTLNATALMQENFAEAVRVVYTANGTAANIVALKSMLHRWGSVICEENTHINTHESGALESMLGNKILAASGEAGKLTPELITQYLKDIAGYGYIPEVIVITQPTEYGVLYTNEEIKSICDLAHERGMYVYIDGARISNALAALGTTLSEMIEKNGVDAFSFGGTKAGAMFGEMVVFRRDEHFTALEYLQKQALQHLDKSKFLGVQMEYLLRTELWKRTAEHAGECAKYLEAGLLSKGVKIYYPVDTNAVFCILDEDKLRSVNTCYDVGYWDAGKHLVRLMTTFDTKKDDIDTLLSLL